MGGPEKGRFCRLSLIDLSGLLGKEDSLNVRKDSSLGDGDSAEKFVQLLVVFNGQLEMSGVNSSFFVIPGSVSSQLKNLSAQIFKNGCEINGGTSSDTVSVVALKSILKLYNFGPSKLKFEKRKKLSMSLI